MAEEVADDERTIFSIYTAPFSICGGFSSCSPTKSCGETINTTVILIMKSTLALLALAALVIPVQAEEGKKGPKKGRDPAKMIEKKDTDGNGSLSLEEFIEGMPNTERATAIFKRLDADSNGELTVEELKARGGKGKGKGKGRGKKEEAE